MSRFGRILAIFVVALGFQIHGFVGAVKSAGVSECALAVAVSSETESGQAVPDKPSPSCKLIGAGQSGALLRQGWKAEPVHPVRTQAGLLVWWPSGPEKPPKHA